MEHVHERIFNGYATFSSFWKMLINTPKQCEAIQRESYVSLYSISGESIFSAAREGWHANTSFLIQYPTKFVLKILLTLLKFSSPCSGAILWG